MRYAVELLVGVLAVVEFDILLFQGDFLFLFEIREVYPIIKL